jgi:nitrogen-specific signal transduction histidine kinase
LTIPVILIGLAATTVLNRENTLVFAGNNKLPPYSYFDGERPAGYSVDLIKILSATMNKSITIKLMPWEKCVTQLETGMIDGLIGTPIYKQQEYISYSKPVGKINFAIFVESGNRYVDSLKSLEGTVVAMCRESLATDELLKDAHVKLIRTESVLEALYRLKSREVTAVIAEKNVGLYYIQQKNIEDIKIVGPPVGPAYECAIAVRENKQNLLEDINRNITILEENGTLEKLERKWFGLHLMAPFPWKMVSLVIGGITSIMVVLLAILWVTSLNATVKIKTRQMQLLSRKMVEKDKLAVLGKLAGQIAHELRTPLSIINNSVYLLRKEKHQDEKLFEKRLHLLEDKVKLTSNILESVLSYSRVKAEVATTVSVKECVEEVIKDMETPEDIKTNVSFEAEEAHLLVFMDFHQLYSVIRNLSLNSIQAMDSKGALTITVFPFDNHTKINIRICDTGPGIPKEKQDKIFNLFYTSKITGTGLGLSIAKSIIDANGGQLYLEKTDTNGTCFMITLPTPKQYHHDERKKHA